MWRARIDSPLSWVQLGKWVVIVSLLPLARPEGAIFAFILVVWIIYEFRSRTHLWGHLFIGIIAASLPSLIFYFAMYLSTGDLIPSSIRGRQLLRTMNDTFLPPMDWSYIVNQCAGAILQPGGPFSTAFVWIHKVLLIVGGVYLWRRRPSFLLVLILIPSLICALLLWNNPGFYFERYASPVLPFGIIIATYGGVGIVARIVSLGKRFKLCSRGRLEFALTLMVLAILSVPIRRLYVETWKSGIPVDIVLDVDGSESLNDVLQPSDLILLYEIQTQYYLESQTISADGIVGGEILPYLPEGDISSFIRRYGVSHVLVSYAFEYRSIYHNTLLHHLWQVDPELGIGDVVELDGLRFTKN